MTLEVVGRRMLPVLLEAGPVGRTIAAPVA